MNGYGYYGWGWTGFRDIIAQWQEVGVFDVVLPLLLIFAVVYAILEKVNVLGENKAVHVIIAIVIGFFAVSNLYVSSFFMLLFQYTGIAIALLLLIIILLGLYAVDNENRWKWIFGIGGFALLIWVLSRITTDYGITWFGQEFSWWLSYNLAWIVPTLIIGGCIALIIIFTGQRKKKTLLEKLAGKQNYS